MNETIVLEMSRALPAGAEEAFGAFADPELLARWWGPADFTVGEVSFPANVGETYRIEMRPPEGDPFQIDGEFREVDRPARLAFTFRYDPADPDDVENLVELEFRGAAGSTEVALRHGPFETEERRDLHRAGWGDSFDKLARLLE